MASPFKVFRKHQKLMLAVLGILVMLSFSIGGVVSQLVGTQKNLNPVIVRTSKYGNLDARELSFMRQERLRTLAVLQNMLARSFQIDPQISRRLVESRFGTASEEDLVNSWLEAKRAEEIGMVISDKSINDFLQDLTKGRLTTAEIAGIIRQEQLTETQFFDIMRQELQATRVMELFNLSLQAFTPAQRWNYFCELRKQATVELVPVEVDRFLAQVKDPSEAEVKELFEKYKDKLPNPNSPEPGFRIPQKIDVQYLKADVVKFSDPATITEEEIQKTYEKNKAYFDQFEKTPTALPGPEAKAPAEKNEAPPAGAESKGEAKEEPKQSPAEKEKPAELPAERPKSAEQPQSTPAAQPAEKPKAGDEPAGGQEKSKEDANKSSAAERSPFILTAMVEQAEKSAIEAAPPEKPVAEKPAEKSAPQQPPADQQKPGENQSKTDNAAGAQPSQAEEKDAKAAESAKPGDSAARGEKAEKAKPGLSEKTKERVRAAVAAEKMGAVLLKAQQVMEENGKKWRRYEAEKIHEKKGTPPPRLDFEELAKKYDLTAGQTGMVSEWEVQRFDIGNSLVEGVSPFPVAAFRSMATFKPDIAIDKTGNEYLFWKINETPEAEPSLEDKAVREQVVYAWKLNQARQLARKEAEQLADTARKSGATLKGAFEGQPSIQVLAPPAFTMYTEGSVPRGSSQTALRLSDVEGVPNPGMDFMHAVFNLEVNQIDVAMNAPQTVAYVIRMISYNPPHDALWQIFLAEDFSKYSAPAVNALDIDRRAWLESLKTYAGFKWEATPDQPRPHPGPESLPDFEF
jgi:hypothetical protein